MTKKHFSMIANCIKSLEVDDKTRATIARALGSELLSVNPRFDLNRFLEACKP